MTSPPAPTPQATPSHTPSPARWRFPYPPLLSVSLVAIAAFGAAQAWIVQRSLNALRAQAEGQALSARLTMLITTLWISVAVMIAFVIGAIWYRSTLSLTLDADRLILRRPLRAPQPIPDAEVNAVRVSGSAWRGLHLELDAKSARARLPLSSARLLGAARTPPKIQANDDARAHPLVAALLSRYGDRVIIRVGR
jgi:hypothetical protein